MSDTNPFGDYIRALGARIERGDATEHTHRPALKALLESVAPDIVATNDPRRVHINATQYFGDIPADVWSFRVGGYQVCEKWLKDRKGRTLDYADIRHYQKIVVALRETIRLMAAIDQTIASHGGWPGVFEAREVQKEQGANPR